MRYNTQQYSKSNSIENNGMEKKSAEKIRLKNMRYDMIL